MPVTAASQNEEVGFVFVIRMQLLLLEVGVPGMEPLGWLGTPCSHEMLPCLSAFRKAVS